MVLPHERSLWPQSLVLDAAQVQALIPQVNALDAMRRLFVDLGEGRAVQPPQVLTPMPTGSGDFITYLGATGQGGFGAKLSPYLPQPGGAPVITAWTLLMSALDGQPVMLCDSSALTVLRTAATTALAVDLLAHRDARHLAIIGAGPVAQAHLEQVLTLREWETVQVFAPSLAKGIGADIWRGLDPRVEIAATAEIAAQKADVVMLCTSSAAPVVAAEAIAQHALVTSISTNAPVAHEIAPDFLTRAEVYCDNRATTPQVAGEMRLAADAGWSVAEIRGDLAEVIAGTHPRPTGKGPVFFRSIGLGLEDIYMAQAIYAAAQH